MATQDQNLSKREKEVVGFLLEGKSNKQIAFALGVSESTVEFHLKNVYAKLNVHSRAETILKLGKSTGVIDEKLRESTVDNLDEENNNSGKSFLWKRWLAFFRDFVSIIKDTIFMITKEIEMKNRLFSYFLGGLIFGIGFWFYFNNWVGRSTFGLNMDEGNPLTVWAFISIMFISVFGIWLIPATISSVYEFRRSKKVVLSACVVVIVWASAVFGYYLSYISLLAFVGLPQMDYYLVFGQQGPSFWQDWGYFFVKYILFDFLKWIIVGILGGGLVGLVTSSFYSFWARKTNVTLPV